MDMSRFLLACTKNTKDTRGELIVMEVKHCRKANDEGLVMHSDTS